MIQRAEVEFLLRVRPRVDDPGVIVESVTMPEGEAIMAMSALLAHVADMLDCTAEELVATMLEVLQDGAISSAGVLT